MKSSNGEDGMNLLMKRKGYENAATPHLIFTDINIPEKSGFEIIKEVRKEDKLKLIPIIVLTSSEYPEDIMLCYTLNVNAVVYKEADLNLFINNMKCILNFFIYNPYSFYSTTQK